MQLSKNFVLSEAEKSSTAVRLGMDNTVPRNFIPAIRHVAQTVIQPVRNHFDVPIVFNGGLSWYRGPALNAALNGNDNSQHCKGEAVDLEVPGVSNYDLAIWIMHNIDFDQLILERHFADDLKSGWVHVSSKLTGTNRKEVLTCQDGLTYEIGLKL